MNRLNIQSLNYIHLFCDFTMKLIFVYFILFVNASNACNQLESIWKDKRAMSYREYSVDQLARAQTMFENILTNNITPEVNNHLDDLNLQIIREDDCLVISEKNKPYRGLGVFVVHLKGDSQLMLQAPHAYHDIKTGSIVLKIMQESQLRAIAINTLNRRYQSTDGQLINADMAHLTKSLFIQFSKAFAKVYFNGRIVQLHGFNADKYSDKHSDTQKLALILSNGTSALRAQIITQSNCLNKALSVHSHVFPKDVNFLGGTTNTVGRSLREIGYSGFEHIEMSLPVRKKLIRSMKMRQAFTRCVAAK